MIITVHFLIQPEGYNEPRHKVGSQISVERISWIETYCTIQHQTMIFCQIMFYYVLVGTIGFTVNI